MFIIIGGLISCSSSSDPIYFYRKQPAKVNTIDGKSVEIITAHGKFLVPDLAENDLKVMEPGKLLAADFVVDMNDQPNAGFKTVADFTYALADSSSVIIPENEEEFIAYLTDEIYIDSISSANLYTEHIDSLAFFEFTHSDTDKNYIYDLIFNPQPESEDLVFYILPKETEAISTNENKYIVYAFDVSEFIKEYKADNPEAKSVTLNFKYLSNPIKEKLEDQYKSVSKKQVFDL